MDKHYDTNQAAKALRRQGHTMRTYYQRAGHAYGIVPIKIGERLYWPKDQVRRVAKGLPAVVQEEVTA